MEFVESGAEVLDMLKLAEYDVVVSDIRMPGMDGLELMTRVKATYPGMIRVALSGQVDLSEVVRKNSETRQLIVFRPFLFH